MMASLFGSQRADSKSRIFCLFFIVFSSPVSKPQSKCTDVESSPNGYIITFLPCRVWNTYQSYLAGKMEVLITEMVVVMLRQAPVSPYRKLPLDSPSDMCDCKVECHRTHFAALPSLT